jgi:putative ABC transport system permease protein
MSRRGVARRLARRELLRSPGRALLTVAMVALPVFAVTAADVLLHTVDDFDPVAAAEQELTPGAEALVRQIASSPVEQDATGTSYGYSEAPAQGLTEEQVLASLPAGSRLARVERGIVPLELPDGPGRVRAVLANPTDPLLRERFSVTQGELPSAPGEIAVGPQLVAAGLDVGSRTTSVGRPLTVVGLLHVEDRMAPTLLALPGATSVTAEPHSEGRSWLVDSPAPVTWQDVQELNALGAVVTSRAVLADPPESTGQDAAGTSRFHIAVFGLVAAMAILEVVLLAGPAFAVGARRQRRALAQLVAAGGQGKDARRVVLATAGLLGVVAAGLGIAAGLGVAALVRASLPAFEGSRSVFPVVDLAIIFVAAVGSALLAALAPARAAARQSPMAVLTDRRDPPRASWRPVVAGAVLLAVGLLASARAARGGDEISVAMSGVPTVLGAVLLAPLALVAVARLAPLLPFAARYAVRDAARQRGRTAPAVGAIAAVVAAAVALGVGASSDQAERRAQDAQAAARSSDALTVSDFPRDEQLSDRLLAAVRAAAPQAEVTEVEALVDDEGLSLCGPRTAGATDCAQLLDGYGGNFGSTLLVGEQALSSLGGLIGPDDQPAARAALAAGGVVAFGQGGPVYEIVVNTPDRSVRVPAVLLPAPGGFSPVRGVLSRELATSLDRQIATTSLSIAGPLDPATRDSVQDAIALRAPEASVSYGDGGGGASDREAGLVLLLLTCVAGVLVIGGVLTSTLLALADARPEFATLHSLGAAARSRRLVAAGYAATLGVVGALLGTAAGLVPGVAVTYPLTQQGVSGRGLLPTHLDIPWLLLVALVVLVPAIAAGVAALTARGPLPGRARTAVG